MNATTEFDKIRRFLRVSIGTFVTVFVLWIVLVIGTMQLGFDQNERMDFFMSYPFAALYAVLVFCIFSAGCVYIYYLLTRRDLRSQYLITPYLRAGFIWTVVCTVLVGAGGLYVVDNRVTVVQQRYQEMYSVYCEMYANDKLRAASVQTQPRSLPKEAWDGVRRIREREEHRAAVDRIIENLSVQEKEEIQCAAFKRALRDSGIVVFLSVFSFFALILTILPQILRWLWLKLFGRITKWVTKG